MQNIDLLNIQIDDNYIKYYINNYKEITNARPIFKYFDEKIKAYILNRYTDSTSYKESIYRILHNIEYRPVCKYCGCAVEFTGLKFNQYCCKKHRALDTSPFKNKQVQDKAKHTILSKYGVDNVFRLEEIREKANKTKLEKYGDIYYNNTEKFHTTCREKYGVDAPAQNKEIREKQVKTVFERYGGYWNKKQVSKTIKEKYGVDWYVYTDDLKGKANSEISKIKQYITKIKNNTFNKSKTEDKCYEVLKEKYFDTIRQYKSEKYPYCCDFYIPSLDLYIEFNGSHYHHGHPFDENNVEDLNELKMLKEKDKNSERTKCGKKSQWYNIIYTWTILDIKKRTIAKQNNLNYIEFWNLNEVKKWLEN